MFPHKNRFRRFSSQIKNDKGICLAFVEAIAVKQSERKGVRTDATIETIKTSQCLLHRRCAKLLSQFIICENYKRKGLSLQGSVAIAPPKPRQPQGWSDHFHEVNLVDRASRIAPLQLTVEFECRKLFAIRRVLAQDHFR